MIEAKADPGESVRRDGFAVVPDVLPEAALDRLDNTPSVDCLVPRGGVMLMRPLLLHAPSAATEPRHRRVIHLEYAADPLPGGLEWFEVVERVDR